MISQAFIKIISSVWVKSKFIFTESSYVKKVWNENVFSAIFCHYNSYRLNRDANHVDVNVHYV